MNNPSMLEFILISVIGCAILIPLVISIAVFCMYGPKRYIFTIKFFRKMKKIKAYDVVTVRARVTRTTQNYLCYKKDRIYHYKDFGHDQTMYLYKRVKVGEDRYVWRNEEFYSMKIPFEIFITYYKWRIHKRIEKVEPESIDYDGFVQRIKSDYKSEFREKRLEKLLEE